MEEASMYYPASLDASVGAFGMCITFEFNGHETNRTRGLGLYQGYIRVVLGYVTTSRARAAGSITSTRDASCSPAADACQIDATATPFAADVAHPSVKPSFRPQLVPRWNHPPFLEFGLSPLVSAASKDMIRLICNLHSRTCLVDCVLSDALRLG